MLEHQIIMIRTKVNINSKDINWEIIRIQPKIEYLLQPDIDKNIIKTTVIAVKRNHNKTQTYMSTKKKG